MKPYLVETALGETDEISEIKLQVYKSGKEHSHKTAVALNRPSEGGEKHDTPPAQPPAPPPADATQAADMETT